VPADVHGVVRALHDGKLVVEADDGTTEQIGPGAVQARDEQERRC